MAIDKKSKAYQSLLNNGYTDEQINQMHEELVAGGKAEDIIKDAEANNSVKVGPMNANLNYYQYGDDSNPAQQGQRGGMNEKYTGEGVKTSNLGYDENIKTSDLDPNYLYGEAAKNRNSKEAGYIARRNDMIASALYNEGLTSREDVANFLSQQNEWMNSTEADRMNTIESVWKRLGQIKPEEEKPDLSKAEDIVQDTSGKLYGKVTAEEGNPKQGIDTLSDANSVFKAMQESQVRNLQDFVSQDYRNIATCIVEGVNGGRTEQTWRDAQKYYPEFISAVNEEVKRQRGQQNITAIASGGDMTTSASNGQSSANTGIANFGTSNANGIKSSVEITQDVHNSLAQNQTASEASETMASIEEDMAILKNRMKNLREEANSKFKGDVPDYLVNAYMNNKAQEIQNQMSILEDRYNAAYTRYRDEIANTQWEKEYQLKQDQLQLQKDELALKEYQVKNGITTTSSTTTSSNATKNEGDIFEVTKMTDAEVAKAVDTLWDMYDNGQLGNAQCAAGIQTYYLPMLGISLPNISSIDRKKALINEDKGYTPKRGDLIILNSKSSPSNGHIGIVLNVRDDGYIEYMDWNGSLDANGNGTEKVAINSINSESQKILGFRNVNKGQGQTSSSSSNQWTDYDYTRFEQYRDATSKSEKETIAAEYGTNVQGMNNIVRDALENRGNGLEENTESYSDSAYDSELGYNPYLKDVFEDYLSRKMTKSDIEGYEASQGWKSGELGRQANNYAKAKANGVDAYDDTSRNIDAKYGFNLDKKMTYRTIANMGGKIPGTQGDTILKELGLNPKDPRAWDKALNETAKWQERQKTELDSQALDSLRAIEYIIMQDATKPQRDLAMDKTKILWGTIGGLGALDRLISGEAASWASRYNYIRDYLTLDYLVDLKNRGATFGALSDNELRAIGNAASLIDYKSDTATFHKDINNLYNTLRESLGYERLDEETLSKMWNAEDGSENLDHFITYDKIHHSGPFGGWDYGKKNIYDTPDAGLDMNSGVGNNFSSGGQGGDGASIFNDIMNN